jgi:hypothetical protein
MALDVVSGADVGVGGGEMPVEERLRRFAGAIVDVDIGLGSVLRD